MYSPPDPILGEDGKVLAQINKNVFPDPKMGLRTYTGIIDYQCETEEIDVDAVNISKAREMIINILTRDYNPGYSNIQIVERPHGIMFY